MPWNVLQGHTFQNQMQPQFHYECFFLKHMKAWNFCLYGIPTNFFVSHCTLFSSPTLLLVSQRVVLKVPSGICRYLTASCLPLLATQKDKNYPIKSNYRSSERNLASAARKQLQTYNCRPALLFQQYVIKALVCSQESLLHGGVIDWIDYLNNGFCLRFGWPSILFFLQTMGEDYGGCEKKGRKERM